MWLFEAHIKTSGRAHDGQCYCFEKQLPRHVRHYRNISTLLWCDDTNIKECYTHTHTRMSLSDLNMNTSIYLKLLHVEPTEPHFEVREKTQDDGAALFFA